MGWDYNAWEEEREDMLEAFMKQPEAVYMPAQPQKNWNLSSFKGEQLAMLDENGKFKEELLLGL